ncbi:MAG: hypothetical protein K8E24_015265, partial [Methanobacterium paludis]|nr:hypothetical protein [Methanobacterium paludis]
LKVSKLCREFNEGIPNYVVSLVSKHLPVAPKDATVAVLGLAMKDYSSDNRISPAMDAVKIMIESGMKVKVYDPAVPTKYDFKVDSLEEAVEGAHVVVVLAKQESTDYKNFELFKNKMSDAGQKYIVDTRNVYTTEEVEANGMKLETL